MKRIKNLLPLIAAVLLFTSCPTEDPDFYSLPEDLQGIYTDYQGDLYYLKHILPDNHADIYHAVNEHDYRQEVENLMECCPDLDEDETLVGIMEIVSSIGDAHTSYVSPMDAAVPLNLALVQDGEAYSYIVTASRYEEGVRNLTGAELLSIEEIPIFSEAGESVFGKFEKILSHDNRYGVLERMTYAMLDPRLLHGLGLTDSRDTVTMRFRFQDGEELDTSLSPIPTSTFSDYDWKVYYDDTPGYGTFDRSVLPDYVRYASKYYHYTYHDGLLHILYNRCSEDPDLSVRNFFSEAFSAVDGDLKAVIIDLRNNGGGDSRLIRPLYGHLNDLGSGIDLYCAIDGTTFSSAVMNAIELDTEYDRLQLIGSPSSNSPNHYGEVGSIILPTGNTVYWSKKFFTNDPGNGADALEPEVTAPLSADALLGLEDPILTVVRERSFP